MGIRIIPSTTFKTVVQYTLKDENGRDEKQELTAHFQRRDVEGVKALYESGLNDADQCRQVLIGWDAKDLVTGEAIPYTPEVRDALFAQPGVAGAMILRYYETVGAARGKN